MNHTVKVNLIADQIINLGGKEVNIQDLKSIKLDNMGRIEGFCIADSWQSANIDAEETIRKKLKEHGFKPDDSFDLVISKAALLLKDELGSYSPSDLVYWMVMYAINRQGYTKFIDEIELQLKKIED